MLTHLMVYGPLGLLVLGLAVVNALALAVRPKQ
jgi:hypothetical protein